MLEITKENYRTIKFNGVIVEVPDNVLESEHGELSLIIEDARYTKGKHGYDFEGPSAEDKSFYSVWYNSIDLFKGFGVNTEDRFALKDCFSWDNYRYYKFEDLTEFCTWYLQQNLREVWLDDGLNKVLIQDIQPLKQTTAKVTTYRKIEDDVTDIIKNIVLDIDVSQKVKELDKVIDGLKFIDKEHGFDDNEIELANNTIQKLSEQKKDVYWDLYKKTDNEEIINLIDSQYPEFKEKMRTAKDKIQEILKYCENDGSMLNYMYAIATGRVIIK